MKRLIFILSALLFFDSRAFAQEFVSSDWWRQKEAEVVYYVDYFKQKSPEEIWKSYLGTKLREWEFCDNLVDLKEPFKSWAMQEVPKRDPSSHCVRIFLSGNYPENFKYVILNSFIAKSRSTSDLFELYDYITGQFGGPYASIGEKYYEILISKILEDISIPNERLVSLLYNASQAQKQLIADKVLYNNPSKHELYKIANSKIETYSELAESMLSQLSDSDDVSRSDDDFRMGEALMRIMSKTNRKF